MVEADVVRDAVRELAPASTREIAEAVDCSQRAAEYQLRKLYADGEVESKAVGNALIWLPADDADTTMRSVR